MNNEKPKTDAERLEVLETRTAMLENRIAMMEVEGTPPAKVAAPDLRAAVADLRARVDHDDESRATLLASTEAIVPELQRERDFYQRSAAAQLLTLEQAPKVAQLRGDMLLERDARISARLSAVETQYTELAGVVVTIYDGLQELLALVKKLTTKGTE